MILGKPQQVSKGFGVSPCGKEVKPRVVAVESAGRIGDIQLRGHRCNPGAELHLMIDPEGEFDPYPHILGCHILSEDLVAFLDVAAGRIVDL
jgi:hypothetical protein